VYLNKLYPILDGII